MSFSRTLFFVPLAIACCALGACEGTPIEGEGEEGEGEAGECGRNGDCALGNVCVDGDCVFGCDEDRDCPGGFACSEDVGDHGACEVIREGEGEGEEGEGEEGEGEAGEGEGEAGEGEGEGEGEAGEGEGEEGEGEGEGGVVVRGAGTCSDPFVAVDGVNNGVIVDRRSVESSSCTVGRGGEDVWRYTAAVPGSSFIAVAHAVDITVAVDLFVVDACGAGGAELACSAEFADDRVVVDLAPGVSTVDLVVDAFVVHSSGAYTLSVAVPEVVGLGDDCDDFHLCSSQLLCIDGSCVTEDDAFCAGEVDVDGAINLSVVGVTQAPSCGGNNTARPGVAVQHTMEHNGTLRLETNGFDDIVAEVRDGCGAGVDAGQCVVLSFNNTLQIPNLSRGEKVHLALFPTSGTTVTADLVELAVLESGESCVPGDLNAVCGGGLQCLGGPSPRGFTCTTVALGDDGDSCVVGSTDARCAAGLACNDGTCGEPVPGTSGEFVFSLGAAPTSTRRVGNNCALDNRTNVNFKRVLLTNTGATTATVSAETTGPNDVVVAAYVPAFDAANAATQCVSSNDDIDFSGGNANGRVNLTIPVGGSAEIIVWPFRTGDVFDFGFLFSSTAPLAVTEP